jgi:3-methyladenine DNA glycosylase AlkD
VTFAEAMVARPELEAKALGVCLLAKFRTAFTPAILPRTRRWLVKYCTDWASTDTLCGEVIGPLLVTNPGLVPELRRWRSSTDLYVRRASAVALILLVRKGQALGEAYEAALVLGAEEHHLLQKAAGWLLREAGKADMRRLDRFLLEHGPRLSRTTVSYAIERFPPPRRAQLLTATRAGRDARTASA